MPEALLYQPRQSWRVAIAFGAAALIHFAAIALATIHQDAPIVDRALSGDSGVIEIIPTVDPVEQPTPPPIEPEVSPIPSVPSPFDEERATPSSVRRQPNKLVVPLVKSRNGAPATTFSSAKVTVLSAPRPEYPYEARRQKITGNGVAEMTVDPMSGSVLNVVMEQSTGSPVLDNAAVTAFRRWRFKPGSVTRVKSPITFTISGAVY